MVHAGLLLLSTAILLRALAPVRAQSERCRQGPNSATACGLPYELANFQGHFECSDSVRVGRPTSVEEVQAMVSMFGKVKASGVGHSWWREQFCAGANASALNIVMTELRPTLDFMGAPVNPKQWRGRTVPPAFPIQVDELDETVTVAAGITQRALLDYLAEYKYGRRTSGWTLPAFSWFLDQTIGGAVATGTHGSSMRWGSLSSQLRGLRMVLANGTLLEVTPRSNPHLFMAAGVSVGRLGIITEVTLKIVPQQAVQRKLLELSFEDFVGQIRGVEEAYKAARRAADVDEQKRALFAVHETQAFWAVPTGAVQRVDYARLDREPADVQLNVMPGDDDQPLVKAMAGPGDNVYVQAEKRAIAANSRMTVNARTWSNLYVTALRPKVAPGTFESRKAYLSMAEAETATTSTFAPYRQLEVAVPLEKAGSCLATVGAEVYGSGRLWEGCRTPFLIRFVTGEDFYLSPSTNGPVMYVNMEDYLSLSTGRPNDEWERIVEAFRGPACGARLHWGKEGWPRHARCFQGAREYPNTWCHMGCAAQQLDPLSKFSADWDGWKWAASRAGAPVPFASCCTRSGFDSAACKCEPRSDCQ